MTLHKNISKKSQKTNNLHNNKQSDLNNKHTEQPNMNTLLRTLAASGSASSRDILELQRTIGNRAVTRIIQTKLAVGPVGDKYEQEAERIANQVINTNNNQTNDRVETANNHLTNPQNKKNVETQPKPLAASISSLVQRSPIEAQTVHQGSEGFMPDSNIDSKLLGQQKSGNPLPKDTQDFMEKRFGTDLSSVRIHTGSDSAQLNRQLSAHAFTYGQHIYMGNGEYNPSSKTGKQLLAHELTHVIQQKQQPPRVVQRLFKKKKPEEETIKNPLFKEKVSITENPLFGKSIPPDTKEKENVTMNPLFGAMPGSSNIAKRKDNSPEMIAFRESRKAELEKELQALGTGKEQDEGPHIGGEGGDLLQMAADPRLKARYQLERGSDEGNFLGRKYRKTKEVTKEKYKKGKSYLPGQHSAVPGDDWSKKHESKGTKVKRGAAAGGKKAAKMALRKIPVVGAMSMDMVQSFRELDRGDIAEDIAESAYQNPLHKQSEKMPARVRQPNESLTKSLLHSMSSGLAAEHKKQGYTKYAAAPLNMINPRISKAVKKGSSFTSGALRKDRNSRLAVKNAQSDADKANSLSNLAEVDPDFSKAMLAHLAPGRMSSISQELYTNKMIQSPPSKDNEEHTLKPSEVAKLARSEKARLRERERMGAAPSWDLQSEEESEKRAKAEDKRKAKEAKKKGNSTDNTPNLDIPEAPKLPETLNFLKTTGQKKEEENQLKKLLISERKKWYE